MEDLKTETINLIKAINNYEALEYINYIVKSIAKEEKATLPSPSCKVS